MPPEPETLLDALADVREALTIVIALHEQTQDRLRYDELQRLADAATALQRAAETLGELERGNGGEPPR